MNLSVVIPDSTLVDASWFDAPPAAADARACVQHRSGWRLHAERFARMWEAPCGDGLSLRGEPWRTLCGLPDESLQARVRRAFSWGAGTAEHGGEALPDLGRRLSVSAVAALSARGAGDAPAVFALAAAERAGADVRFCLALRFERRLHDDILPACRHAMSDSDRRLGAMLLQALHVGYPDAGLPARQEPSC